MTLPPRSRETEREEFLRRALSDTGFLARNVLGMDTDRDERGNPIGTPGNGGIRSYGPHQEMVEFLDSSPYSHRVLLAPRYSYKSSLIQAFIIRKILAHPNISILLFMHEQSIAETRCRLIRNTLANNPVIKELFGNLVGPSWQQASFITSLRTDTTLQSPTLWVASPQKIPTGGRPNLVIFDDVVSDQNFRTERSRGRVIECFERSLSLGSRGEVYIDVGTPYHDKDGHQWCLDAGWHGLTHLDIGFDVVTNPDGTLSLEGEGRWPHLSKEFLERKLRSGMTFQTFMSQFKLRVVGGLNEAFARHQFQPIQWNEKMQGLTGYLLTDVAPSGNPDGALNVLLYVGVDERDNLYMLDCEIGFWKMYEFVDRYLLMLQRWQHKVNHRLEMWEHGLAYLSYHQHILIEARKRNVRVRFVADRRNQSAQSKDVRIASTQGRFQASQVFVVSTMPRTWQAEQGPKTLWDPEGHIDTTGARLPGGELVQQFVRFPHHPRKDIPDAFSLVNALDKETQRRVVCYAKPANSGVPESVQRRLIYEETNDQGGSTSRFYRKLRNRIR